MNRRHLLLACASASLLTACVTAPTRPELTETPTLYSGRFSISFPKEGLTQREQGGFEWKIQSALAPKTAEPEKAMQLSLLNPLGSIAAIIAYDPKASIDKRASFTSPLQTDYAPTLNVLMQRTLGWRLPLTELLPWLETTEPRSQPEKWAITVVSRFEGGLPKLLTAHNPALSISVRLVFEE